MFSVIEQLYFNGYLHRDISINNVVLANGDKDPAAQKAIDEYRKRLEGFLIDYDYAINFREETPSALADRTVRFCLTFAAPTLADV